MAELLGIAGAGLGGIAIGAFFFAGLWWTVQKGVTAKQPGLHFLASLLVRTLITVTVFYCLARGDWRNLAASLVGFITSRFVVSRFIVTRSTAFSIQPKRRLRIGEVQ